MAKRYVKAYYDWIEQTAALSDAERGRLFIAILQYARSGLDPKLDGREGILFPAFKAVIDRDNEVSAARAAAGAIGGGVSKPKQNEANVSKTKQTEANVPTKDIRHKTEDIRHKTEDYKTQDSKKESLSDERDEKETQLDAAFERFWEAYPKKVDKKGARRSFAKVKAPLETLLQAVEQQKQSRQWQEDNGRFIPNPTTWLNQERWETTLETPEESKGVVAHTATASPEQLEQIRKVYDMVRATSQGG